MSSDEMRHSDGLTMPYVTGDPSGWPEELDAMVASPKNHRILFENDQVRVLEVLLEPGQIEQPHHHRWPAFVYVLEASDLLDRSGETGEVIGDSRTMGQIEPGISAWKECEAIHYVENVDPSRSFRLLRFELKS